MEVSFTRLAPGACLTRAVMSGAVVLELYALARHGLPHSLEHFVVESALDRRDGLWGPVARSWGHAAPYHGADEDLLRSVRAALEQARAAGWAPGDRVPDVAEVRALQAWGVDADGLERAWRGLVESQREWDALAVGDVLTRTWPVALSVPRPERRGEA